jgi:hypothetical protein
MKYIQIPGPVSRMLRGQQIKYDFHTFLDDIVWPDAAWRTDREWWNVYKELRVKFQNCTPGLWVGIEDSSFEKLLPIATQRGKRFNEGSHELLESMMDPFFNAANVIPAEAAATSEEARN